MLALTSIGPLAPLAPIAPEVLTVNILAVTSAVELLAALVIVPPTALKVTLPEAPELMSARIILPVEAAVMITLSPDPPAVSTSVAVMALP